MGTRSIRNAFIVAGFTCVEIVCCRPAYAGGDFLPSAITSYFDNVMDVEYVIYMDYYGNLDVLYHDYAWHSGLVVQAGMTTSFVPGSSIVSYFDGANGHLFYQTAQNHIIELHGNPPNQNQMTDLTQITGSVGPWGGYSSQYYTSCPPNGTCGTLSGFLEGGSYGNGPLYSGASALSGFYDGRVSHIFYPAGDGALHETYYDGAWYDHGVTTVAQGPDQAFTGSGNGGLATLWDGTIEHAYYVGYESHQDSTDEAYFFGGPWYHNTLATGGGRLFGFLASVSSAQNYQYVLGAPFSGTGTILLLENYPGSGGWLEQQFSAPSFTNGCPLIAYTTGQGSAVAFYAGMDLNVYNWPNGILMSGATLVGASQVMMNPGPAGITGFWDGTFQHVFYIGGDSHVHEFYGIASSGWQTNDLMASQPSWPLAAF